MEPDEARELARRVRCPVLVIHGEQDALGSVTRGIALAEDTGGELVTLEGWEFVEDGRAVLEATRTETALLAGICDGGGWALMLAATQPAAALGVAAIAPCVPRLTPSHPNYRRYPSLAPLDTDQGWARWMPRAIDASVRPRAWRIDAACVGHVAPRRSWAAASAWSPTATRSPSTWPPAAWPWRSTRPSWTAAARPGSRRTPVCHRRPGQVRPPGRRGRPGRGLRVAG
jgi:pimeloyl-ACP methyl ester carboxylesterase